MGKLSLAKAYESAVINAWMKKGYEPLSVLQAKIPESEEILHLIKGKTDYGYGTQEHTVTVAALWVLTDKGIHTFGRGRLIGLEKRYRFIPYSQITAVQVGRIFTTHGQLSNIIIAFGFNHSEISYINPSDANQTGILVNNQINKPKAVTISSDHLEDVKPCPDCAENVKSQARKCRFCGFTFD